MIPKEPEKELIYPQETYAVIGAAMEVYNTLKPGMSEGIFQEALGMEFDLQQIPAKPLQEIHVVYKGKQLRKTYIADFVAYGVIIIEIKALSKLGEQEVAQAVNYLKATGMKLALLINLGNPNRLEWKRIVNL